MKYYAHLQIKLTDYLCRESDINAVELCDEMENIFCYLKPNISSRNVISFFKRHDMTILFSNLKLTLRMFLPIIVAMGENHF